MSAKWKKKGSKNRGMCEEIGMTKWNFLKVCSGTRIKANSECKELSSSLIYKVLRFPSKCDRLCNTSQESSSCILHVSFACGVSATLRWHSKVTDTLRWPHMIPVPNGSHFHVSYFLPLVCGQDLGPASNQRIWQRWWGVTPVIVLPLYNTPIVYTHTHTHTHTCSQPETHTEKVLWSKSASN